jgi:ssDNA-binding Zn-finger/Zn-ribbon topoisomerase 1
MSNTPEGGEGTWLRGYDAWVAACQLKHGGRYVYSPERVRDQGVWKVRIVCPEHGEFLQNPAKHKFGQKCPVCAGNTQFDTLGRLTALYPNQVFPEHLPQRNKDRFELQCPEHGSFAVTLNQLLSSKFKTTNGEACPKCNIAKRGKAFRRGDTIERLILKHPRYTFHGPANALVTDQVTYLCPDHGTQSSRAHDMLNGSGCPQCANELRPSKVREAVGVSLMDNVLAVTEKFNGSVILHSGTVNLTKDFVRATCVKHGGFDVRLYSLKAGHGCPKCGKSRMSRGEIEVAEWLRSQYLEVDQQCRGVLERGELDMVVGSVAIEYGGLYWHGEGYKTERYHLEKAKDARQAGLRLLTLFEDEWLYRKDAVKSVLAHQFGVGEPPVMARKTAVRRATWSEVSPIYESHHLQGVGSPCGENYALELNGTLIAAMSFKADRFGDFDKELVRFASSVRVIGGFSKLFSAFRREQTPGLRVVSYCDLRWFTGDCYRTVGFKHLSDSAPGYWWCKGTERFSRMMFQKYKLREKLSKFDENLTEEQNMRNNGFWKIHDCGMGKWGVVL